MIKKILIVDDHKLVLDGLSRIVENSNQFQLVATATNGKEALGYLEHLKVDILMTDLDMPEMNGQELTVYTKKHFPNVRILILTMHDEKSIIQQMLSLGADGYILKTANPNDLVNALKEIAEEKQHIGQEATQALETEEKAENNEILNKFTSREIEILKLIAGGLSNKEIGEKLFISHRTVDTHRTNLMKKIDVHNIAGLIRFAMKNKLID